MQRTANGCGEAERTAQSDVDPARMERRQQQELLCHDEWLVVGSITPPDPSRIDAVRAPIAASSTAGAPDAMPGTP